MEEDEVSPHAWPALGGERFSVEPQVSHLSPDRLRAFQSPGVV